jgi:hypothetical protein
MNIVKLQNMLRGVPDESLINYVQNPQGEVPSYLALSELQRRKDTRAKYQAEQTPESSVAEDLEQETMSDQGGLAMLAKNPDLSPGAPMSQGVADLPIDDSMYQEDSFAAGGIVAFDGRQGSFVSSVPRPNYEGPATSAIGRGFSSITGGLKGYADKKSKLRDLQQQIETLQPNLFESLTPSELSTRKAKIEELKAQQDAIRNPSSGYVYKPDEKAVDPTMKSFIEQEKAQQDAAKNNPYKPLSDKEKEAIKKQFNYTDNTTGNTPAQQPADSYEDALRKRMAVYKEFMGPNEDRDKLNKKIEAMEARAARQEEMAPWMALTEAGFKTMQGTSPFALANLGAGAQAGLQSYAAAQDRMANLEEKRYALMNEAAKADRAERQAAVTFGENSYQHQAALEQKERLGQAELALKREANRLTASFNNARLNATTEKGLLKSQAEQMIKVNKNIDEQLAYLATAPKSEKITAMINNLLARKAENEAHVKSIYTNLKNPGLANTDFRSSDFTVEELPSL